MSVILSDHHTCAQNAAPSRWRARRRRESCGAWWRPCRIGTGTRRQHSALGTRIATRIALGTHLPCTSAMNSARVTPRRRNPPRIADVIITVPGFCAPRIVRQRCSASITTAAPSGDSPSISVSAIWLVSRSCICGRRARISTAARDLADADDAPLRHVADMRLPVKRQEMVLAQ